MILEVFSNLNGSTILSHQVSVLQATATYSKSYTCSAAGKPLKSNTIMYVNTEEMHREVQH